MNTKVLLVDDEKLERALIRKGYAWDENGFEITGEADNGEEALKFFCTQKPDIVITDINMPYMDGLVLTEKIMKRSPKCRIIIITGYREFNYAQQALRLGVKDFILKPVNISELAELAGTIRQEIAREEGHDQEYSQLKETVAQNQGIVMESFLQRLVENRIEEEEAIHKLQIYHLEQLADVCACIDIKPYPNSAATQTLAISNRILKLVEDGQNDYTVAFIHYLCNIVLYFHSTDMDKTEEIARNLKDQIIQELHIHVDIGISQMNHGFEGISRAFRQAEMALSASVITERDSCITYGKYEAIRERNQGHPEIDWQDFSFHINNCSSSNVERRIDEYTQSMKFTGIAGTEYLKLMTMNMLSKASSVLNKHGKTLGQLIGEEELYNQVSGIQNVEDMNACLKAVIRQILIFCDRATTKKSSRLLDQTMAYLETHLYDTGLTLRTVAAQVYANESYLSRMFKQETGEGLIEYITRRRIEKSIILLNTTDLKVYEIAEQVGFSDPHYFSICFKKQVGVTVKRYKKPQF